MCNSRNSPISPGSKSPIKDFPTPRSISPRLVLDKNYHNLQLLIDIFMQNLGIYELQAIENYLTHTRHPLNGDQYLHHILNSVKNCHPEYRETIVFKLMTALFSKLKANEITRLISAVNTEQETVLQRLMNFASPHFIKHVLNLLLALHVNKQITFSNHFSLIQSCFPELLERDNPEIIKIFRQHINEAKKSGILTYENLTKLIFNQEILVHCFQTALLSGNAILFRHFNKLLLAVFPENLAQQCITTPLASNTTCLHLIARTGNIKLLKMFIRFMQKVFTPEEISEELYWQSNTRDQFNQHPCYFFTHPINDFLFRVRNPDQVQSELEKLFDGGYDNNPAVNTSLSLFITNHTMFRPIASQPTSPNTDPYPFLGEPPRF